MVYFSSGSSSSSDDKKDSYLKDGTNTSIGTSNHNGLRGKLHFLKFETSKIDECIKFISSKHLQNNGKQTNFYMMIDASRYVIYAFMLYYVVCTNGAFLPAPSVHYCSFGK